MGCRIAVLFELCCCPWWVSVIWRLVLGKFGKNKTQIGRPYDFHDFCCCFEFLVFGNLFNVYSLRLGTWDCRFSVFGFIKLWNLLWTGMLMDLLWVDLLAPLFTHSKCYLSLASFNVSLVDVIRRSAHAKHGWEGDWSSAAHVARMCWWWMSWAAYDSYP